MNLVKFTYDCTVSRPSAIKDEWDNETCTSVFTGKCLFRDRQISYQGEVISESPVIYIPSVGTGITLNDFIEISNDGVLIATGSVSDVLPYQLDRINVTKVIVKRNVLV